MSESPDLPPRPPPPRSLRRELVGWLRWMGPLRLILSAMMAALLVSGGYWLVRAPRPPTEASLPRASVAEIADETTTNPDGSTGVTVPASSVPATTATSAVVHVAGAVAGPGVYRLDGSARVHTAIDAAGGPTVDADLNGLNLAAPIVDGQRIYVPADGEVDPADIPDGPPARASEADAVRSAPIDLNRADADELEALPGVGPATASAIIEERARNGPFASVDDLDRVSGIGPAKLEAIRDFVTV